MELVKAAPDIAVKLSTKVTEFKEEFPVLVISNVYFIISPRFVVPSPSTSITSANFLRVTVFMLGKFVMVGSASVSPAPIFPTSLVSETLLV